MARTLADWGPQAALDLKLLRGLLRHVAQVVPDVLLPRSSLTTVTSRGCARYGHVARFMSEAQLERLVIDEMSRRVAVWAEPMQRGFATLYAADGAPDTNSLRARVGRLAEENALGSGEAARARMDACRSWREDMSTQDWDVVVAGAGPSGLALASACAERGLRTLCIAPDVNQPWENNFGTWVDELEPLGLEGAFGHVWDTAVVHFDAHRQVRLPRRYGRIDAQKLRTILRSRGRAGLLTEHEGRVVGVEHDASGSTVLVDIAGGQPSVRTKVLVDATGFGSTLIERPGKSPDALQVAYGVFAKVKKHPLPLDEMLFMDFRDEFLADRSGPPTFLYAMPFSHDTIFLEETSLVCRPAVSIEFLKQRLEQRLPALGIEIEHVEWEERCFIPMNVAVPSLHQRVLGFGAAAGLVHPGSGFSVSLSLRLAPRVADVLCRSLTESEPPARAVERAWAQVWPVGRLRTRRAHLAGMEIFIRSNAASLRRYLGLFFKTGNSFWKGYLSGARSPTDLARAFAGL